MARSTEEGKTTYLLEMKDGTRRKITVPSSWKLSFGPLVPGSKDTSYNSREALVLRIWEGSKDNQRACITGVAAFRDMELPMEEEIVKTHEETLVKDTPEGQKAFIVKGEVKEWINPDDPKPLNREFKGLPSVLREVD
jgi:hypothetical protein